MFIRGLWLRGLSWWFRVALVSDRLKEMRSCSYGRDKRGIVTASWTYPENISTGHRHCWGLAVEGLEHIGKEPL